MESQWLAHLDDILENARSSLLGTVTARIPGKRSPVKHEVDRSETHIQIMEEGGDVLVKPAAYLLTLERMRGGEDSELGHVLGDVVGDAGLALEFGRLLKVALYFTGNNRYV